MGRCICIHIIRGSIRRALRAGQEVRSGGLGMQQDPWVSVKRGSLLDLCVSEADRAAERGGGKEGRFPDRAVGAGCGLSAAVRARTTAVPLVRGFRRSGVVDQIRLADAVGVRRAKTVSRGPGPDRRPVAFSEKDRGQLWL